MSGVFDPQIWTDGEDPENTPTADDLNREWRDAFNFLLGITRPMAHLVSTTGTAFTTTETTVPFNVERLLRGGMVHSISTNNHQLTLPVTGQYQGYIWGGFDSLTTVATRAWVRLKKNGTTVAAANQKPELTSSWNVHGSVTVDAVAGDIMTMTMNVTSGSGVMGSAFTRAPRMVLWYVGDYS